MLIDYLTTDRYTDFYKFNQSAYPAIKNVETQFQLQVIDNPWLYDKSNPNVLIALNKENGIIGQIILNPFQFHYGGQLRRGFLGFDYFVVEDYRKYGVGSLLARKVIKEYKPKFSIGATDAGAKIWVGLGGKIVGSLDYFVWIRNPVIGLHLLLTILLKDKWIQGPSRIYEENLPKTLKDDRMTFCQCEVPPGDWNDYGWNGETIRFARSKEFLKWRFFDGDRKYYFYVLRNSNPMVYFVGRTMSRKGMKLFVIVDYSVPFGDKSGFEAIVRAGKMLAKLGRYDGVLILSSHWFFDGILRKNFFVQIRWMPHRIIMNADFQFSDEQIRKRDCLYTTFVDYDKEFL